jgi:preprotein translocase subunit SecD
MIYLSPIKIWTIIIVAILGVLYATPNLLSNQNVSAIQDTLPNWLPGKTVNLGLDLQGGSHLLLQIEMQDVIKERLDSLSDEIRRSLRKERIGYTNWEQDKTGVSFLLRDTNQETIARQTVRKIEGDYDILIDDSKRINVSLSDQQRREFERQVIGQSIEIIRRRIDETGTREPVIQAQGSDRILVQLPGIDDPDRVKDLLGQTAKMSFNLVSDATGGVSAINLTLPFAQNPNQSISVQRRSLITGEMLVDSQPTFQDGAPVVSFRFDATGARRFCDVTKKNVGRPFAIVLDGEVISAPVIQDAICGGSGIISGNFTTQEASDLSLLLRAGALPAPLTIIEERTVGPSLGADSVEAGRYASMIAIVAVLLFMTVSYGLLGLFANIALIINMFLIMAVLSIIQATLTLPGIAGIVLTVGMAVDANVLIFERIREEFKNGRTIISSIDSGYQRAFTTIVDANLTTLIAAVFLYTVGTGPVKGFAVTLTIGILTSMFSAIMLTRGLVVLWFNKTKPKDLPL